MKENNLKLIFDEKIKKINEVNKVNKISLSTMDFNHKNNSDSPINNLFYSIKDNFATKNHLTTGGSLFLENYIPAYDSTVKSLLDEAGAICVSKDNLDEFGLGGTGLFSGFGNVLNINDHQRIAGGSSSGSACMVAYKIVDFAIGTDTGDSIRKPASYCGVIGFKPTYGAISRYGLFPYSPSLDHVGILANDIKTIAAVFSILAKNDKKDMTSIDLSNNYLKKLKPKFNAKLVVLNETIEYMHENEKALFIEYLNSLQNKGFNISYENFSIELLKLIDPIYKTISYSEAVTSWANLTGILFGGKYQANTFDELILKNRSELFGRQLKRRFVIGSFITSSKNYDAVFNNAKKVRTLIIKKTNELFKKYDAILMPSASSIAPLIDDVINHKNIFTITDDALQIANFAGIPSITIPAIKYNSLDVGLNISTKLKKDIDALNIALAIMEVNK